MDQTNDSKKQSTPTPRRTLGLRRISPRITTTTTTTTTTPSIKRTSSHLNRTGESSSKINEDIDSLVTPTRKRTSLGRFVFSPKPLNVHPADKSEGDGRTAEQLREAIKKMEAHLQQYKKYKIEKKELQRLIGVWTAGGNAALTMLQQEMKPEQEIEQILTHLKLPTDIFGKNTNV